MKPKILTNAQALELKWFCRNVAGVRNDMYETIEKTRAFDERLTRLEKTCSMVEKYLGENLGSFASFFEPDQKRPLVEQDSGQETK